MPRWNNPKCGFQKGHEGFSDSGQFKKGHIGYKGMLGKKLSKNHIEKIRLSHLGKILSDEIRKKMSDSHSGRTSNSSGYILLHMPEHPFALSIGYVSEHRYVAEVYLGRFLDPEEVVHHIDGDKKNNLPENLYVFSSNSEHTTYHHKKNKEPITKSNLPTNNKVFL